MIQQRETEQIFANELILFGQRNIWLLTMLRIEQMIRLRLMLV